MGIARRWIPAAGAAALAGALMQGQGSGAASRPAAGESVPFLPDAPFAG